MYLKKKKSQPNRLESSHVTFEFKDDQCMLKAKLNEPVLTRSGTIKAQLKEPLESAYIEMSGMHEVYNYYCNTMSRYDYYYNIIIQRMMAPHRVLFRNAHLETINRNWPCPLPPPPPTHTHTLKLLQGYLFRFQKSLHRR